MIELEINLPDQLNDDDAKDLAQHLIDEANQTIKDALETYYANSSWAKYEVKAIPDAA
jgi:hypothetical protein